ncbi:hypothetical protein FB451DRAFT_1400218 [Mycena latifolia]|nr:hypothetical protein FB451DRAFT_1400218 [Mycena latifolia]
MPQDKPKILRSASYWRDFHRLRAQQRARLARGFPANEENCPPVYDSSAVWTFVPNRTAPLVTPRATGAIFHVPSSIGVNGHRCRAAEIEKQVRAIIDVRPDADMLLLAWLAKSLAKTDAALAAPKKKSRSHSHKTAVRGVVSHRAPMAEAEAASAQVARRENETRSLSLHVCCAARRSHVE